MQQEFMQIIEFVSTLKNVLINMAVIIIQIE
jgi:hypothetical protein